MKMSATPSDLAGAHRIAAARGGGQRGRGLLVRPASLPYTRPARTRIGAPPRLSPYLTGQSACSRLLALCDSERRSRPGRVEEAAMGGDRRSGWRAKGLRALAAAALLGALGASAAWPERALAAAGDTDDTFNGGKVITDFGGIEEVRALAIQPDGKLVAVGTAAGTS